jgi:hypothetical protein
MVRVLPRLVIPKVEGRILQDIKNLAVRRQIECVEFRSGLAEENQFGRDKPLQRNYVIIFGTPKNDGSAQPTIS